MSISRGDKVASRPRTQGRLRAKVVVAGVVHVVACLAWITAAAPRVLGLWLIGATLVAAYFSVLLWRSIDAGIPSSRLGAGTGVTLARVSCLSLLSGYLLSPPSPTQLWHVAGLYAAIGAGDWLDGFLARRTRYETRLGELLDMRVDMVGMLVAPAVAVMVGRLPVWYLVLSVAAFVFHGALAVRPALGRPSYPERLRPSVHARAFAGFQMALIAAALVPLFRAEAVWVVATVFMVPSLAAFGRDWLVATGYLVPDTQSYRRLIRRSIVGVRSVVPLLLRPAFAVPAFWLMPAQEVLGPLWGICAVAVLLGLAPRLFALCWLGTLGVAPSGIFAEGVLLATASSILLLGTGYFSLYQPEEQWFFGRHGGGGSEPMARL